MRLSHVPVPKAVQQKQLELLTEVFVLDVVDHLPDELSVVLGAVLAVTLLAFFQEIRQVGSCRFGGSSLGDVAELAV